MSELLDLLQAGDVAAFNATRGDRRVELFAEELAELKLPGVDLSHCVLDKSDLTESDLTEAHLVGTGLNDIDGTGLILDGAIALGCKLRDAWLEDADLTGADLSRADLAGAVLHRTRGEGLRLLHARLKGAGAHEAQWPLADLSEARANDADFTGADLSRTRWAGAEASRINLSGADLTGADAVGVKWPEAQAAGAVLRAARLPGAQLPQIDLSGADLRDADLAGVNLVGANLSGADLRGAVLSDATLDGVNFEGAKMSGVDLAGVDVSCLSLTEVQIGELSRHGAVYDPDAPLSYDEVDGASLGSTTVLVWRNAEEGGTTIRWARSSGKEAEQGGVLAVRGERVMHHAVIAAGGVAWIHVLTERPDGATVLVWTVGPEGPAKGPVATPLGYDPGFKPLLETDGTSVKLVGLARQGPTLVVHEGQDPSQPLTAREGRPMPTARGFVGRRLPVLLGKGGVVQQLDGVFPRKPVAVPEGFPGPLCDAIPLETERQGQLPRPARTSEVLAVWVAPAGLRDPGGVRALRLGQDDEAERVGVSPDVLDLEVIPDGEGGWVAWIEQDGPDERAVSVTRLPGGKVHDVASGDEPWTSLKLLGGESPRVILRSLLGRVEVRGLDGSRLGWFGQKIRFG